MPSASRVGQNLDSKDNCEEVMDTKVTKWQFCCDQVLYYLMGLKDN